MAKRQCDLLERALEVDVADPHGEARAEETRREDEDDAALHDPAGDEPHRCVNNSRRRASSSVTVPSLRTTCVARAAFSS